MVKLKRSTYVLPTVAEIILKDARLDYENNQKFTTETLHTLSSVFGQILIKAMHILDTYKFIKYAINSGNRSVHKIYNSNQQYVLFNNINYCTCEAFIINVLSQTPKLFTCEHVLSLHLADIVRIIKTEIVLDSQLTDLLNNQICGMLQDAPP